MDKKQKSMELTVLQSKIFEIRGTKVLLDFDLAKLYEVENRALKQSVKRNEYRFPKDFIFQLTSSEWRELITNCDNLPESIKFSPLWLWCESGGKALVQESF